MVTVIASTAFAAAAAGVLAFAAFGTLAIICVTW